MIGLSRLSYPGFLLSLLVLAGCAAGPAGLSSGAVAGIQQDGVSRLEEGRTGFSISESADLDPAQQALFQHGVDALASGDYDEAVEAFAEIGEAAPDLNAPDINLAIAYLRDGRDELAEEPLQRVLERVAGHPLASHEYGLMLRRAGRFDEARAVYERSLEIFPEYFPLRRNLGVLCDIYLDDAECAVRQFELLLEAQPEDDQVRLWLAEVEGRRNR